MQYTRLYFAFSLGEFIFYSLLIKPGNVEVLQLSKPFSWEQIEFQPFSLEIKVNRKDNSQSRHMMTSDQ